MKLGIIGLPNVGKSTLFNSLTKAKTDVANYPFCTIDPNVGVVNVPDPRLEVLSRLHNSEKTVPAVIEFVDIAGLVRGAGKGEGLGNRFLSHIREVDAVLHVVRCFEDANVSHVDGAINPARDIETIDFELIFSDIETVERRISKAQKLARTDKSAAKELELAERLRAHLESGERAATLSTDADERELVREMNLLTSKPVIFAANVDEADLPDDGAKNPHVAMLRGIAGAGVFVVCAKIEAELADLDEQERQIFLSELGVGRGGLDRLIEASYELLNLISFLTAGPKEVRAWTISKGTKAPQAAGKIHSDFERGFIRAEIVAYEDLARLGSLAAAKERGLVRLEGKEYEIKDNDVVLFRFNV